MPAADLLDLIATARPLIHTRDQVVHSVWMEPRPETAQMTAIRMRICNDPTIQSFSIAELVELHGELAACASRAIGYFWEMGEAQKPRHDPSSSDSSRARP
jgi:hypothetical protein